MILYELKIYLTFFKVFLKVFVIFFRNIILIMIILSYNFYKRKKVLTFF